MDSRAVPAPVAAALLDAGYRVGGPAGVGAGGPVWTATRVAGAGPGAPERVVVQVIAVTDDAARTRLDERLEALWALDHPHLPAVVDVVVVPDGASGGSGASAAPGGEVWAVLLAEVPGATVAALLASRGRLSTGEVVTLTVPVAGALDALHRSGLVHGDVSPANVVVRPDGRPVLIDVLGGVHAGAGAAGPSGAAGRVADRPCGTPGFIAPERFGAASPPSGRGPDGLAAGAPADVYALAGVALAALDLAAHDGRLGAELRAATAADPVRRPPAAELAAALYACAEPEPIAQPDAGVLARTALAQLAAPSRTVSVPTGGRHRARQGWRGARGRRRPAVLGLVVALAVPGVVWAVVERGGPGEAVVPALAPGQDAEATPTAGPAVGSTTSTPPPGPSPTEDARPDPVEAAAALTRRRTEVLAEVLASGDARRLTEVVQPGSAAHRADRELMDRLRSDGVTLEGAAAVVEDAALVPPGTTGGAETTGPTDPTDPPADTVDVRVRSGLTAHERRSSSGATQVPAGSTRAVVLRLVWTDAGWRVTDVRPA